MHQSCCSRNDSNHKTHLRFVYWTSIKIIVRALDLIFLSQKDLRIFIDLYRKEKKTKQNKQKTRRKRKETPSVVAMMT